MRFTHRALFVMLIVAIATVTPRSLAAQNVQVAFKGPSGAVLPSLFAGLNTSQERS